MPWQREQLTHHEQKVVQLEQELSDHRLYPPDKGAKSRVIHDYMEKESYLQFEVCSSTKLSICLLSHLVLDLL